MKEIHSRLVAIMFVQVTESVDELIELPVASYRLEESYKELLKHINAYRGEYLEINSGEIYACFTGAVSAFNAALCLQSILPRYNLRIGLHLGEVLYRNGKFQGKEVNLASRLPMFARAGGICISQSVYQYIEEKEILVALGVHKLKHVDVGVPLFAYLPSGQATRCKWRELKQKFLGRLPGYNSLKLLIYPVAIAALFLLPHAMDLSVADRKVLKIYVAEFELQSLPGQEGNLLQGIELGIRAMLAGSHDSIDVHLLSQRSGAQIELLVTIKQLGHKLQAGYNINELPLGNTLAYGGFEVDEKRLFHLQDLISEHIITVLEE